MKMEAQEHRQPPDVYFYPDPSQELLVGRSRQRVESWRRKTEQVGGGRTDTSHGLGSSACLSDKPQAKCYFGKQFSSWDGKVDIFKNTSLSCIIKCVTVIVEFYSKRGRAGNRSPKIWIHFTYNVNWKAVIVVSHFISPGCSFCTYRERLLWG